MKTILNGFFIRIKNLGRKSTKSKIMFFVLGNLFYFMVPDQGNSKATKGYLSLYESSSTCNVSICYLSGCIIRVCICV